MKTIGLIGGTSWESTVEYYRLINELTREKLGGWHSAKCLIYSIDFAEIVQETNWVKITSILCQAAKTLESGGAECILICANTMHKTAEDVQKTITIPLIHITDVTGEEIKKTGLKTVGLLGTKFTMEEDFYKERLSNKFGLEVIVPDNNDREFIHHTAYHELVLGIINQSSKEEFMRIIARLEKQGARGIILGCTEIPLLIKQDDVNILVFDTTQIHAGAAVEFALK